MPSGEKKNNREAKDVSIEEMSEEMAEVAPEKSRWTWRMTRRQAENKYLRAAAGNAKIFSAEQMKSVNNYRNIVAQDLGKTSFLRWTTQNAPWLLGLTEDAQGLEMVWKLDCGS